VSTRERAAEGPLHPRTESAARRRRRPIAVKLGALLVLLVALPVVIAGTMFSQLRDVSRDYDGLLATQVQQGLQARKMQVEFKKQVQEWKDILLRGSNPADLTKYTGQFHEQADTVRQLNAELLAQVGDPATHQQLAEFQSQHQALNDAYEAALAPFVAAGARDPSVPDSAVRGRDRPPTDLLDGVVNRIETSISDAVAARKADVARRQQILLLASAAVLIAVLVVVGLAVQRIVRPIRRLTRDAYRAAYEALPAAVEEIRTMPAGADPPTLAPVRVETHDELEELGRALSTLQSSAVGLAVDQHQAQRESVEMLINLGRRNQNLLGRTLSYISELERTEQNPAVLAQLFRLDHTTTRIRRGAESMLVLAGATQTRTWSRPVPVADVARAALSEIEDYQRVDLYHLEPVAIVGTAVADLVHLIAELAENATHFSPPDIRVTIVGQHDHAGDRYRLRVIDQGIGMTGRELDEANRRIQDAEHGLLDAKLLGLHVVGLLAARRGVEVMLEPSAGRGITATLLLPRSILAGTDETDPQTGSLPVIPAQPAIPVRPTPPVRADTPAPSIPSAPVRAAPVRAAAVHGGGAPPESVGAVPRRVRGAQLPDSGRTGGPAFAAPDTDAIKGRLDALQAGVRAARDGAWPPPVATTGSRNGLALDDADEHPAAWSEQ
jgi:hypothetical protein